MKENGFRLKALVGAMFSTTLLFGASNAFAERATYAAPGAFNGANEIAVSSGSDALGDVLLFPYYTTENDNSTLVHVVNTSKTDTTIIKFRIRDFSSSDDGLDFTVVLSPEDIFSGTLNKNPDSGKVEFKRSGDDNTCTSPIRADGVFSDVKQDTKFHSGHIEVITMATFNDTEYGNVVTTDGTNVLKEIADSAKHENDANHRTPDCNVVDRYFRRLKDNNGRNIGLLQDALDDHQIRSNLFGQFAILNLKSGISAGGRPTAIANAYRAVDANNDGDYIDANDKALHSPCYLGSGNVETGGNSIICGQFPDHFPYPSLIHVAGVDVTGDLNATKVAKNVKYFNMFQDTMRAQSMANEWSINTGNQVKSEMIYTFPTKYVYKDSTFAKFDSPDDINTSQVFTGVDGHQRIDDLPFDDVDAALTLTTSGATSAASGYFNDITGCAFPTEMIRNRDEGKSEEESLTSVSGVRPDKPEEDQICNEVTALTLNMVENGNVTVNDGVTQKRASNVVLGVDADVFQKFGWLKVGIVDSEGNVGKGLPMIGYSMWSREFGNDASASYGHIMDNVKFKTTD